MEKSNSGDIKRDQEFFLNRLIKIAYLNCPYYNKKFSIGKDLVFKGINLENLHLLPITPKKDVKLLLEEMINSNLDRSLLREYQSSGSTGEPKTFYQDKESQGWRLAGWYLGWKRAGYHFGDKWIKTKKNKHSSTVNRISSNLKRCFSVDLATFDEKKLKEAYKTIIQSKPDLIYSNTNTLFVLSEYFINKTTSPTKINNIITQGSILFPHFRQTIETAFQSKVYDTYGGDGIVISGQCDFGNYHVNDLGVIVEVVDDNYQPVPNGTLGRLLVTDLHNYAMPMIRYEIGDLGTKLDNKCECGGHYSLMKQPHGRDTDIIKLSNNISLTVHQFGSFFVKIPEIIQFQIIEENLDYLLIRLVVTKEFSELIRTKIYKMVDEISLQKAIVHIELVDEIPLEKSNKRRYMIGKNNNFFS